jgi:CheY-like chemotaxis protein
MQPQKRKLNSILLIDDDEVTNFYNAHVIKRMEVAEHIHFEINGEEALNYLIHKADHAADYVRPDLIFLDINMPVMNGFEFLAEYEKLPAPDKSHHMIVMLTTSLHEDDLRRAGEFNCVSAYYPKPLDTTSINEIIEKYFEFAEVH